MNYAMACSILRTQERNIRKVDGFRFVHSGYEYRIVYEGGFTSFVSIQRRLIGKRNFKFYDGFGAYNCCSFDDVMQMVYWRVMK